MSEGQALNRKAKCFTIINQFAQQLIQIAIWKALVSSVKIPPNSVPLSN